MVPPQEEMPSVDSRLYPELSGAGRRLRMPQSGPVHDGVQMQIFLVQKPFKEQSSSVVQSAEKEWK